MRRTILGAVLVLAVSTTAHADDKKKAKALYDEGLKHYNLAEYPDAVVVQTHRDPLKVVASVSALMSRGLRM